MPTWDERIKELQKENEERGYSTSDIEKIKNRVKAERRDWIHKFDCYINTLVDKEFGTPEAIVKFAEQMADFRNSVIDRRYPDGEWEEYD